MVSSKASLATSLQFTPETRCIFLFNPSGTFTVTLAIRFYTYMLHRHDISALQPCSQSLGSPKCARFPETLRNRRERPYLSCLPVSTNPIVSRDLKISTTCCLRSLGGSCTSSDASPASSSTAFPP